MENKILQQFNGYQLTGNWLNDLNPVNKVILYLLFGLTSVFVKDYRYGIFVVAAYLILAGMMGVFSKFIKAFAVASILLSVLTIISRTFLHRNEGVELFRLFGFVVRDLALKNGLDMTALLLGFTGSLFLLFLSTPMRDIMLAMEQRGWITSATSYMVLVSFTTINTLIDNMKTILESQRARGIETEGKFWVRFKACFPVIRPTVLAAIAYTEEKCISMEARAFALDGRHSYIRMFRPVPTSEKVFMAICCTLFACISLGAILSKVLF